jgi:hypothetical protein
MLTAAIRAALVVSAVSVLAGCVGDVIRTVPSTNDPAAWGQPWVSEEARDHERFVAWRNRESCQPFAWPYNDAVRYHPECACHWRGSAESCEPNRLRNESACVCEYVGVE